MTAEEKIPYFEYFVKNLIDWHHEKTSQSKNDLSILKVLKLLFFTSAIGTNEGSENTLLDNIFDNFYAMPYGHVESDIYNVICDNRLNNIVIDNNSSRINTGANFNNLSSDYKSDIDKALKELKNINPDIITDSSFKLVDLSHAWYSWQYNYSLAKKKNLNSIQIPKEHIKEEEKIFFI